MAEPRFATGGDDDLPLTLRRAREERDRELRQREEQSAPHTPTPAAARGPEIGAPPLMADPVYDPLPIRESGTVTRLDIPFLHLVQFCVKAVFAAIPALLVLACLLWLGGRALQTFFPDLGRMKILIQFGT